MKSFLALRNISRQGFRFFNNNGQQNDRCFGSLLMGGFKQSYSTQVENQSVSKPITVPYKTKKVNPAEHTYDNVGLFYEINDTDFLRLFPQGLSEDFMRRRKSFLEASLMIRKPSLDIINLLKDEQLSSNAPPKFVLYGEKGIGKTSALCHVLHYLSVGSEEDWQILYVPWVPAWFGTVATEDGIPSTHNEGYLDTPKEARDLLMGYKRMNKDLLVKHAPTLISDYEWSHKDKTNSGSLLSDLIDFGIERPKFASDVVGALLKEIRLQSHAFPFKTALVVDGLNAFYQPTKRVRVKDTKGTFHWHMQELSLVKNISKLLVSDWSNGTVLCTVDETTQAEPCESYSPKDLLGKEGFLVLHPFIPVLVDSLSDRELESFMNFCYNKYWIREKHLQDDAKKEIKFLCGNNPEEFYEVVKDL